MKTNHQIPRAIATAVMLGACITITGCRLFILGTAVGAGAATVAYIDGKLEANYGNPYDKVVDATREAISQLGFAQPEERKDGLSASFSTHDAKGTSIKIDITKSSETSCTVDIRVGVFGDQAMSMAINDKIKSNL